MHLIGKRRKIEKKNYTAKYAYKKKADAIKRAKNLRKKDWNVRIIPTKCPCKGKEYYLFVRKRG
jgi:hypothetical protein